MGTKSVEDVVAQFCGWAEREGVEVNGFMAQFALAGHQEFLGRSQLGNWRVGDMGELLLDYFPKEVPADPEDVASTPGTIRALLDFLLMTGRLTKGRERHIQLVNELDQVAPGFADAMADPTRFGLAKSVVAAMVSDSVDVSDPDAVQAWIEDFNRRPQPEGLALTGGPAGTLTALPTAPGQLVIPDVPLGPVRLCPRPALGTEARGSALLGEAATFAEWVGAGRAVTARGLLTRQAARAAIQELDLCPVPENLRSAADVGPLHRLWRLAGEVGLIEIRPGRTAVAAAETLRAWRRGDDDEVLAIWLTAFRLVLDQGVDCGEEREAALGVQGEFVDGALPVVLAGLCTDGAQADVAAVLGLLEEDMTSQGYGPGGGLGQRFLAAALDRILDRLTSLGAVERGDGRISLTGLGAWGMREILVSAGHEVPVVGELAAASADELLDRLATYDEATMVVEFAEWADRRGVDQAVAELLTAAADGGPAHRMAAFSALSTLPLEATGPAVRAAIETPALRAYARMWLVNSDLASPETVPASDIAWLLADGYSLFLDADAHEDSAAQLDALGVSAQSAGIVEELGRCGHPRAREVLRAIGDHHTDHLVAKRARKAAFRLPPTPHP